MLFEFALDNTYLFVKAKRIYKFKAKNGNPNFPSRFCLGSISNAFDYVDSEEVSFKRNAYDFSVDYSAIDKSNNLKTHKYLTIKNNLWMLGLLKKVFIGLLIV